MLREWLSSLFTAAQQPFIRNYVRLTVQDPSITAKESFDFWRSKAAPFHVCWSALGNEQRETGFNWTAVGDKNTGGAHGIAQWHEDRRQFILHGDPKRKILGSGIDVNTAGHKGQLAAMYWELQHTGLWDQLLATKDIPAACDILVRKFERPKQIERDIAKQIGFAKALRDKHADWETQAVPPMAVSVPVAVPVPAKSSAPPAAVKDVSYGKPVILGKQVSSTGTITAPAIITKAKGAFPTHLYRAGAFKVVQKPCPHLAMAVQLTAPRAGVLHTTEGNKKASRWQNTKAAFGVFDQHFAPQFLVGVDEANKPQIYQLVPVGVIGAALRAHNDKAIVQIELVAFSQETPWLPDEDMLEALASLMSACEANYGIPLRRHWKDGDYGRYGSNPHRQSGIFGKEPGWFGHGDVNVEDVHWDPGAAKWSVLFDRAKALGAPAPLVA